MNIANSSNTYCFHISLEDFKHEPDYLSTIYTVNCVLHSIFAVLTIFGNTTVLVSIWKTPSLYTPPTVLLASLPLSDLAVGALVQLAYLPYKVAELYQDFHVLCELRVLFNVSGFFLSLLSCFIVTAISLEKYLAIYLHLRYQQIVTVRRVQTSTLGSVLIAAASTVLVVWYEIVFLVTGVLILACLVLLLFANIRMLSNLSHHHRQIHDLELPVRSSRSHNTEASLGNTRDLSVARYRKSVFTVSYVVAAMLICYLPYLCSILARSVVENPKNSVRLALNITHMITFANSAWNPFFYCCRIREIHRAVMETLLCKHNSSFQ